MYWDLYKNIFQHPTYTKIKLCQKQKYYPKQRILYKTI